MFGFSFASCFAPRSIFRYGKGIRDSLRSPAEWALDADPPYSGRWTLDADSLVHNGVPLQYQKENGRYVLPSRKTVAVSVWSWLDIIFGVGRKFSQQRLGSPECHQNSLLYIMFP